MPGQLDPLGSGVVPEEQENRVEARRREAHRERQAQRVAIGEAAIATVLASRGRGAVVQREQVAVLGTYSEGLGARRRNRHVAGERPGHVRHLAGEELAAVEVGVEDARRGLLEAGPVHRSIEDPGEDLRAGGRKAGLRRIDRLERVRGSEQLPLRVRPIDIGRHPAEPAHRQLAHDLACQTFAGLCRQRQARALRRRLAAHGAVQICVDRRCTAGENRAEQTGRDTAPARLLRGAPGLHCAPQSDPTGGRMHFNLESVQNDSQTFCASLEKFPQPWARKPGFQAVGICPGPTYRGRTHVGGRA